MSEDDKAEVRKAEQDIAKLGEAVQPKSTRISSPN